jgi:hypothetical protein
VDSGNSDTGRSLIQADDRLAATWANELPEKSMTGLAAFIVINLETPSRAVVQFSNRRARAEQ